MGILVWLGALEVDGRIPGAPNVDAPLLQKIASLRDHDARARTAKLSLGPVAGDAKVSAVQGFIAALYTAWVNGVPLAVDG